MSFVLWFEEACAGVRQPYVWSTPPLHKLLSGNPTAARYVLLAAFSLALPLCALFVSQTLASVLLYGLTSALVFHQSRAMASGAVLGISHGLCHLIWKCVDTHGLAPDVTGFYDQVIHLAMAVWAHGVATNVSQREQWSPKAKSALAAFGGVTLLGTFAFVTASAVWPSDHEWYPSLSTFSVMGSGYFVGVAMALNLKGATQGNIIAWQVISMGFMQLFLRIDGMLGPFFAGRFFEIYFCLPLWAAALAN